MKDTKQSDFGPVIAQYTDDQAVDDGFLVQVPCGRINRATRAVFDKYTQNLDSGSWMVTDITQLRKICDWLLKQPAEEGWHIGTWEGTRLWAVPNEVHGFTIMLPEDY